MGLLKSYYLRSGIEAGCDEAGRGCLAGPVYAAAVVLPKRWKHPLLDDSKKLTAKRRLMLRDAIEKEAVAYAVARLSHHEIDQINILNASIQAMHRAVSDLGVEPTRLLIDGNRFTPYRSIEHHCIIKGDGKYASIAAASILAKTYRDEYMEKLHSQFPHYAWDSNKGYPTHVHRKAIIKYGPCEYHRKTFRLYPETAELPFPKDKSM